MNPEPQQAEFLRHKLNGETARIGWRELQRFFAAGRIVAVDPRLDLVEVALRFALDDAARVRGWLEQGWVGPAGDEQARRWYETDATVWSVTVKPWVLVQAAERSRRG